MKKYLILIISVLLMALALCACGSSGSSGGGQEAEQTEGTASSAELTGMPEFETVDFDGNSVDSSVFSEADITVVNFWGTYCGPCINEMPELAEWAEEMPDNVQIIGIAIDVADTESEEFKTGKEIIADTGVKYRNLLVTEQFAEIFDQLVGVPTTYFVDRDGKFLAKEVLGADVEAYKKTVEELL